LYILLGQLKNPRANFQWNVPLSDELISKYAHCAVTDPEFKPRPMPVTIQLQPTVSALAHVAPSYADCTSLSSSVCLNVCVLTQLREALAEKEDLLMQNNLLQKRLDKAKTSTTRAK